MFGQNRRFFSIHSNDEPWCPLSQRHRKATALQPLQPPFLLISSKFWCRYDPLQRHNIQYEWSAELFYVRHQRIEFFRTIRKNFNIIFLSQRHPI